MHKWSEVLYVFMNHWLHYRSISLSVTMKTALREVFVFQGGASESAIGWCWSKGSYGMTLCHCTFSFAAHMYVAADVGSTCYIYFNTVAAFFIIPASV